MKNKKMCYLSGIAFYMVLFSFVIINFNCSDTVTSWFVSDEDEIQMGEQFVAQIEADTVNYPLYKNKSGMKQELVDYIDSIGQSIAKNQTGRTDIDYSFTVIDNDSVINAFAVPGGFVYIYTGLIIEAKNEAEIAGVLAHEIGHITQRHGVKQLIKSYGVEFVKDLILGDSSALSIVVDVAAGLTFLKYSRNNEFQADSCSVEYLIETGYNPNGMKTFLQTILDYENEHGSFNIKLLSTHPPTDERIEAVESLIAEKGSSISNLPTPVKRDITP